MNFTEKAAYIKGMIEGLKLDENKDEVKVLNAISELLNEIAQAVSDLEESSVVTEEMLDVLDEDLGALEEVVYEGLEDDACHGYHHHHIDNGSEDEEIYEVTCPSCGNTICVDEDMLDEGQIICSSCGETLEFDFDEVGFDEEAIDEADSE